MQILALVDAATSRTQESRLVYADISKELARWLLDQFDLLQQMLAIPGGGKPLWVTYQEATAVFCLNTNTEFDQFRDALQQAKDGYIILPEHFRPDPTRLSAGSIVGTLPHMVMSEHGVSWHIVLQNSTHHGTAPIPPTLLADLLAGRL